MLGLGISGRAPGHSGLRAARRALPAGTLRACESVLLSSSLKALQLRKSLYSGLVLEPVSTQARPSVTWGKVSIRGWPKMHTACLDRWTSGGHPRRRNRSATLPSSEGCLSPRRSLGPASPDCYCPPTSAVLKPWRREAAEVGKHFDAHQAKRQGNFGNYKPSSVIPERQEGARPVELHPSSRLAKLSGVLCELTVQRLNSTAQYLLPLETANGSQYCTWRLRPSRGHGHPSESW